MGNFCCQNEMPMAHRRFTETIPNQIIASPYRSIISEQPTRHTEPISDLESRIFKMHLRGGNITNQDVVNDNSPAGSTSSTTVPEQRHPSQQTPGNFRILVRKRSALDDNAGAGRFSTIVTEQRHPSQQEPSRDNIEKDMETKHHKFVSPGAKKRQSPRNTVQRTAKKLRLSHESTTSETRNYTHSEPTTRNEPTKLTMVEEKVIKELIEIREQARPFEGEIEKFEELKGSDNHYYIEESLRRLVDKLDGMFDDNGPNQFLRDERKKVYKVIFPLFKKLDNKAEENRKRTLLAK